MIFNKARELGSLIQETAEAKRLSEAKKYFESDKNAKLQMQEYKSFQKHLQDQMQAGLLTQDELDEGMQELKKLGFELKQNPLIAELIEAENEFNQLVNKVLGIIRYTITGEEINKGCNCGGGCSGCH